MQKDCFEVYALVPGLLREEVCALYTYILGFPHFFVEFLLLYYYHSLQVHQGKKRAVSVLLLLLEREMVLPSTFVIF